MEDRKKQIRLVATDLDGTLLRKDHSVSPKDQETLARLGTQKIIRVIATGRNLRKIKEVIPHNDWFDYIIFSSGAGIIDCKANNQLIYYRNLSKSITQKLATLFVGMEQNFILFSPVPNNSYCQYFRADEKCPEFLHYLSDHKDFASAIHFSKEEHGACQFLLMFKTLDEFLMVKRQIEKLSSELKILRVSSPFGTDYIWMEIFNPDVSKGNAVRYLCEQNKIEQKYTFGIGNDFNDLDLLNYTNVSYVVDNAPEQLKSNFLCAPDHEKDAFSYSLQSYI